MIFYIVLGIYCLLLLLFTSTSTYMLQHNYINNSKIMEKSINRFSLIKKRLSIFLITSFILFLIATSILVFSYTNPFSYKGYFILLLSVFFCYLGLNFYYLVKVVNKLSLCKLILSKYPNYNSEFNYIALSDFFENVKGKDSRLDFLISIVKSDVFEKNEAYLIHSDELLELERLNTTTLTKENEKAVLEDLKYILELIHNSYANNK